MDTPEIYHHLLSTMSSTLANLTQHNYNYSIKSIPAIVYLATVMLVGFIGNSIVCYVYLVKLKRIKPFAYFILALAIIDLVNCVINIPFEIFHLTHRFTIGTHTLCKIKSAFSPFVGTLLAIIIVPMSVYRYKKICRPLNKQMTTHGARLSILCCFLATCIISGPCVDIYGPSPITDGYFNGSMCAISKNTNFNHSVACVSAFCCTFVVVSITIVLVYSLIWRQVVRSNKFRRSLLSVGHINSNNGLAGEDTPRDTIMTSRHAVRYRKTTLMLFLISLVFILTYLPHLVLIAVIISKNKVLISSSHRLSGPLNVAYNIGVRSYFISSASNPMIYSYCNMKFRHAAMSIFKRKR
ncbi:neuropeptides capa receptor-like [Haliotis rufescens]|uniref:neuropeptides capa receptor-like n=1 Tax=Haliotis rufescens TaxID=6454 RepID=UPI00201F4714|nr:neuropeptides capa receptor-like [Haliotis rufescens]